MRRTGIICCSALFLIFTVAGCESNNKGKIEGSEWISQSAKVKGIGVPGGMLKLSFRNNGTLIFKAGPRTMTGKYSLGMGDRITFHLDEMLNGSKTHVEKAVIVDDRLTLTDSDGTKMNFTKCK